jgi:hypothetical protein
VTLPEKDSPFCLLQKQNTLAYINDQDQNVEIERKERVMTVKKESNASIKEYIVRWQ